MESFLFRNTYKKLKLIDSNIELDNPFFYYPNITGYRQPKRTTIGPRSSEPDFMLQRRVVLPSLMAQ